MAFRSKIAKGGFGKGDLHNFCRRFTHRILTSGGLRIDGGSGSAVVETQLAFVAQCKGVLVTKAAGQNMAALSGTVANGTFNIFCFYVDSGGTLTTLMGTAGATLAAVIPPGSQEDKALIGFVIINPTGTGDFVGGTTTLDSATVVPNAVFCNVLSSGDLRINELVAPY